MMTVAQLEERVERLEQQVAAMGQAQSQAGPLSYPSEMRDLIDDAALLTSNRIDDILSPSRLAPLCDARAAIAYVAHDLGKGPSEIGRALGGRDHSTIATAISRAEKLWKEQPNFRALCVNLFASAMTRRKKWGEA